KVDDVMEKAVDKLCYVSEEERVIRAYELAEKDEWIKRNQLKNAKSEGREEGRKEEQISIARAMIKGDLSIDTISEFTGLTIKEINDLFL
ncbi:MAG: hypothetical protein R3Y57_04235, partial [Erysipelotrichaceae bacterium]